MIESRSGTSRCALTLVLAFCLASAGCAVCFPLVNEEGSPVDAASIVPSVFGDFACVEPLEYLFLILMGFGADLDETYSPGGLFLRPEPIGQLTTLGGHVALTLDRQGEVINTAQVNSGVQAFDAVVEPLGAANLRLPGAADAPLHRRVFMSDADGQTVVVIDPATRQVVSTIVTGRDPHGLAFSPDGSTLYVGNNGSGTVSVVDVATLTVTTSLSLPGGGSPQGVAVTPDGATLYVVNGVDSGTLVVFDLAGGAEPQSIRVGRQPKRIRLTPDGSLAFIANFGANNISVLDTRTNTLVAALNADRPSDMAVSADGNFLYAVSAGTIGKVTEISIATLQQTRSWDVGDTPTGIQILPGGATLLATNMNSPFVSLVDLVFDGEVVTASAPEGLGPAAVLLLEDRPVLSAGD